MSLPWRVGEVAQCAVTPDLAGDLLAVLVNVLVQRAVKDRGGDRLHFSRVLFGAGFLADRRHDGVNFRENMLRLVGRLDAETRHAVDVALRQVENAAVVLRIGLGLAQLGAERLVEPVEGIGRVSIGLSDVGERPVDLAGQGARGAEPAQPIGSVRLAMGVYADGVSSEGSREISAADKLIRPT